MNNWSALRLEFENIYINTTITSERGILEREKVLEMKRLVFKTQGIKKIFEFFYPLPGHKFYN